MSVDNSNRPRVSTPDLVPWIPPGKSKFNAYAHKKNSGPYDFASSVNADSGIWATESSKKSIKYNMFEPKLPKRSISGQDLSKKSVQVMSKKRSRIDNLLNASHNSDVEREYLRKRIMQMFNEDDPVPELKEEGSMHPSSGEEDDSFPDANAGRERRGSDPTDYTSKGKKNKSPRKKKNKSKHKHRHSKKSSSTSGFDDETPDRSSIEFIDAYYSKDNKSTQFDPVPNPGNTPYHNVQAASLRSKSAQTSQKVDKTSQTEAGLYYDDEDGYFSFSPSPRDFQSIQLDRASIRPSRLSVMTGPAAEAWVILPRNESNPSRRLRNFTAVPLNFANSIGSRLQQSFAQINRSTPVESIDPLLLNEAEVDKLSVAAVGNIQTANKSQPLLQPPDGDKKRRSAVIAAAAAGCCALFLLTVLVGGALIGTLASRGSGSADLSGGTYIGPGMDNSTGPCVNYMALTEKWRRIVGYGPSNTGEIYHCDMPRIGNAGIREGWYRFQGEAGTHIPTSSPGAWNSQTGRIQEVCGTSMVAWMNGDHPTVQQGVVTRPFCFDWENGSCQYGFSSQVRTCPDPKGSPSDTFYVYYFKIPRDIQCNFAYCAM